MVLENVKTTEDVSESWVPKDGLEYEVRDPCASASTASYETRFGPRTIFVPARRQPMDIVEAYPYSLPFPMFHAGIPRLNREKVEYFASAMADPDLRWENMSCFSVARYKKAPLKMAKISMGGLCFNPEDFVGENVLVSGHHRFMAFLLCGLPPSKLQPIRINLARYRVHHVYPWWMVRWSEQVG